MDKEYKKALEQAKANLADAKARGKDAMGVTWGELRHKLFTPEEIAASDLRVAMMIEIAKARKERGISQKKLEEMSGVKQPIIARMEKGSTSPQLDTILKVLAPLGKTLYIGDLDQHEQVK
ncbi:MAG: helix-turn-helix domain-containing protein [Desulfuromonadales bacterium]|nr:helix-turn-helix domain-containing protein [Desulfuromonadales bacterium]